MIADSKKLIMREKRMKNCYVVSFFYIVIINRKELELLAIFYQP